VPGRGPRINAGTKPAVLAMRFDLLAPAHNIVRIQSDAKQIGRNESQLSRIDSNIANHNAVDPCHQPPLPALLAQEDHGTDRQHTGNIVKSKHNGQLSLNEPGLQVALAIHRQNRAPMERRARISVNLQATVRRSA
jgi:hypothetical protein